MVSLLLVAQLLTGLLTVGTQCRKQQESECCWSIAYVSYLWVVSGEQCLGCHLWHVRANVGGELDMGHVPHHLRHLLHGCRGLHGCNLDVAQYRVWTTAASDQHVQEVEACCLLGTVGCYCRKRRMRTDYQHSNKYNVRYDTAKCVAQGLKL